MSPQQTFYLDSLVQFIIDHSSGDNLVSPQQSKQNLENNLVGIYNMKKSSQLDEIKESKPTTAGCGLRLTTDGYILTAYHVIEAAYQRVNGALQGPDFVIIGDQTENIYYLDPSVMVTYPQYDLALIKAYNPSVGEPIPFNINHDGIQYAQRVSALALHHRNLIVTSSRGFVYDRYKDCPALNRDGTKRMEIADLFMTSAAVSKGNSGGIFITEEGSLAGIISSALFPEKIGVGKGCGIDICYGLELIGLGLASMLDINL